MALGISLDTQETLLKYINSLHSYLQHILLMFNLDDFDEVCVQAINIESGGKPFKLSSKSTKEMENKESRDSNGNSSKRKKSTVIQKERPTYSHCQRIDHDESKCWKLHTELKPKKFLKQ